MDAKRWLGWLGMAALALLIAAGSAEAQLAKSGKFSGTYPFHWRGQATESGENRWFAFGMTYGVFQNAAGNGFLHNVSFVCPYADDINQGKETGSGPCVATDSDGDKIYMDWRGTRAKGAEWFAGDTEFTGGTGKYKGITGKITWKNKAITVRNGSEGENIAYWEGEYRLP